jgi:hypothetical protein
MQEGEKEIEAFWEEFRFRAPNAGRTHESLLRNGKRKSELET